VVSGTRDPDPPVFRAVPLALHLISHSLGNKRSWSMTERPYCIPILNSYGLRNDRSWSRVEPVDYSDFFSAQVVGTVLQRRSDSISDTEKYCTIPVEMMLLLWRSCLDYDVFENVALGVHCIFNGARLQAAAKMWHRPARHSNIEVSSLRSVAGWFIRKIRPPVSEMLFQKNSPFVI